MTTIFTHSRSFHGNAPRSPDKNWYYIEVMPLLEILSFLLFACSALCFASALQTWSLRQAPRAKTISLLLASCAVWALCATQELHAPLLFQPFWSSLSYLGAAWVGPLLFLGTQTPSPTRPWWLRPGLHTIFPLFTWITVASNPWAFSTVAFRKCPLRPR